MRPETRSRLIWLTIFAVAMAQLEAAVVVYLREIYYPNGFDFPLVIIPNRMALVELGREVATIVMILAIARLTTRDPWRRFAAFLWVFGVWDIFYYVWLYVMLGWPPSLFTWDILFLIPLPWVGPVLAPVLIAVCMMLAAVGIERLRDQNLEVRVSRRNWVVVIASAILLLTIFMWDAPRVLKGLEPVSFLWAPYLLILTPAVVVTVRAYRLSAAGELGADPASN